MVGAFECLENTILRTTGPIPVMYAMVHALGACQVGQICGLGGVWASAPAPRPLQADIVAPLDASC